MVAFTGIVGVVGEERDYWIMHFFIATHRRRNREILYGNLY